MLVSLCRDGLPARPQRRSPTYLSNAVREQGFDTGVSGFSPWNEKAMRRLTHDERWIRAAGSTALRHVVDGYADEDEA